jgi:hypothetical protein
LWGLAAGDSGAGAGLIALSDFIAGKPAPTGLMQLLWGRLPAIPTGLMQLLWEPACRRFGHWRSGEISVFAQSAT